MKTILPVTLAMLISSVACAGQVENINACVTKAKEFAGISLNEFDASYEGNIFANSKVLWNGVQCEAKSGNVFNLTINNKRYIYEGFAGVDAYRLNGELSSQTETAKKQLWAEVSNIKQRIALLDDRMERASNVLTKANPDQVGAKEFVETGINKALNGIDPSVSKLPQSKQSNKDPKVDSKPVAASQTKPRTDIEICVAKGVKYYKALGSFPELKTGTFKGRLAKDVAREKCGRSLAAFQGM
ncbi:MAG: hypothetical protein JXR18_13165 [Neptuniibacter sp.]